MVSVRAGSPFKAKVSQLALQSARGQPPSKAELKEIAKHLDVDVKTLQHALDGAMASTMGNIENAGVTSA